MPTDPYTGLYSTQVSYQPTGALGAVTELLNAQKAQNIANTLQQEREAQAGMSQAQLGEYEEKHRREQQLRDLMASPELQGKTFDERINAAIGSGLSDLGQWAPYARAGESAQARRDVAATQAGGRVEVENIRQGATGAPLPTAKAGEAAQVGNLAGARAEQTKALTPSMVELNKAKSYLLRMRAQLAQQEKLTASQTNGAYRNLTVIENKIASLKVDKYGLPIEQTPEVEAEILRLENLQREIRASIATKSGLSPEFGQLTSGASPEQKAKASGTQNPTAAPASVMKFNPATGTIE